MTCFTSFLTLAGFFIPFVYIKTFLNSQIGLDDDQSTTVLAVRGQAVVKARCSSVNGSDDFDVCMFSVIGN